MVQNMHFCSPYLKRNSDNALHYSHFNASARSVRAGFRDEEAFFSQPCKDELS